MVSRSLCDLSDAVQVDALPRHIGSLESKVSFAEHSLFYKALLQKETYNSMELV